MAEWKTFDLSEFMPEQVSGSVDKLQGLTDIIITAGNVANTVLEVLRVFMTSFPNPAAALVQTLLGELQTIIDNLQETGAFGLFMIPTSLDDLETYRGGYPKFRQIFLQSLNDVEDPNRPQVGADGALGAFFLLFTSPSAGGVIQQSLTLKNIFAGARNDVDLKYPAPVNLTIEAADEEGRVPGSMLNLFAEGDDLTTLILSWEEPKYKQSIFYDIFAQNNFYIERSKSREGVLLTREKTRATLTNPLQSGDDDAAGEDAEVIKEPVLNRLGEPIYTWEPLNPDDPFFDLENDDLQENYLAGTYSYTIRGLDKGIENGYYYRIRSVPKDTKLRPLQRDPSDPDEKPIYLLELNEETYLDSQPSGAVFGHLPDIDTSFDLPTALLNIYRAAYMLRFDVDTYDDEANLQLGSSSIEPVLPLYLEDDAKFESLYGEIQLLELQFLNEDVVNTLYFEGPLFDSEEDVTDYESARRFVSTAGTITSSTTLENDPFGGTRELFNDMFNLTEQQRFRIWVDKAAMSKIESLVPVLVQNDSMLEIVREFYESAQTDIMDTILDEDSTDRMVSDSVRTAIHLLIQVIDRHDTQGTPPNWRAMRLFADLIPEADQIMDRLFGLVNSLGSVFSDPTSSLDGTIEGLQNRLAVLDELVDFLDETLSFFVRLQNVPLASILFIPPASGGVPYLTRELLQAENPPSSGPGEFFTGVVLAVGGAGPQDYMSTVQAIKFIFGV